MRKPRHTFVRTLALLALLVSSLSFFAMPAASAPQAQESQAAAFQAATGTVTVSKYVCDGLDGVVWNGTLGATCEAGAGTFDFYLYGDGTDESWTLVVDGTGTITLAAGTYAVFERGSWTSMDVVVTAGANTAVTVQNPSGDPLPPPPPPVEPETGFVTVEKYYCPGVETVSYDPALVTGDCWVGDATFAFYLYGDGTDDYRPLTVGADGVGTIELAVGTYQVVEQNTFPSVDVDVTAGATSCLTVVNPGGPLPEPDPEYGFVEAVKFYCPDATEAYFLTDEDIVADNCVLGPATFTFYLVGDGTADYAQLEVDGSGTIGLEPGIYEVVEEGTQAHFEFEVYEGENTVLFVNNPMPDDGEVPDDGDTSTKPDDKDKDTSTGGVTKLPSTGSGTSDSTGALALAVAAAAALSGVGAFTLRKKG